MKHVQDLVKRKREQQQYITICKQEGDSPLAVYWVIRIINPGTAKDQSPCKQLENNK